MADVVKSIGPRPEDSFSDAELAVIKEALDMKVASVKRSLSAVNVKPKFRELYEEELSATRKLIAKLG